MYAALSGREAFEKAKTIDVPHALIAIYTPGDSVPEFPENLLRKAIIRLCFADGSNPDDPDVFDDTLARFIAEFVDTLPPEVEAIFVRCDAGLSRSTAIAAALVKFDGGRDSIFFTRAFPNSLVYYKLFKELEKRKESREIGLT